MKRHPNPYCDCEGVHLTGYFYNPAPFLTFDTQSVVKCNMDVPGTAPPSRPQTQWDVPHSAESFSDSYWNTAEAESLHSLHGHHDSFTASSDTGVSTNFPLQVESPFHVETLEPRMVFQHPDICSFPDLGTPMNLDTPEIGYAHDTYVNDLDFPHFSSLTQQDNLTTSDEEASPTLTNTTLSDVLCKTEDGGDTTDKPYARLIYECLMQAPGRQRMLRDIYDWFIENTTKPQVSGSSGWQNSIRHNLSMNQAFENDKSVTITGKGQARKANSIWKLTNDAIQNGVQSTTRYRKTGNAKRGMFSRSATVNHDRSGVKNGRTTRRSAGRLRKHEKSSLLAESHPLEYDLPCWQPGNDLDDEAAAHIHQHDHFPATPAVEGYEPLYKLPHGFHAPEDTQHLKVEYDGFLDEDDIMRNEILYLPHTDPSCANVVKVERE